MISWDKSYKSINFLSFIFDRHVDVFLYASAIGLDEVDFSSLFTAQLEYLIL